MKDSKKKDSGKKEAALPSSVGDLRKKQSQLTLELSLGKTRDTAELRDIRREIARRLTELKKPSNPASPADGRITE